MKRTTLKRSKAFNPSRQELINYAECRAEEHKQKHLVRLDDGEFSTKDVAVMLYLRGCRGHDLQKQLMKLFPKSSSGGLHFAAATAYRLMAMTGFYKDTSYLKKELRAAAKKK